MTYAEVKEAARNHVRKSIYEKTKARKAYHTDVPFDITQALGRKYAEETNPELVADTDRVTKEESLLRKEVNELRNSLFEKETRLSTLVEEKKQFQKKLEPIEKKGRTPEDLFDGLDKERRKRLKEEK